MPIDFAPPQPNAQPFNIAPVQYTDPLQTLAQMGQLRTQALQQQNAQMQLQQNQMALKSNQAMMQAFAQGNGDWEATQKLLDASGDILPSDRMALEQHAMTLATQRATLTKEQQAIQDHDNEQWSNILNPPGGINSQDDFNNAIQRGASRGLKVPAELTTPQGGTIPFTDPAHVKALANSLLLPSQLSKQQLETAQAGEATATAGQRTAEGKLADVNTQLAQHKIDFYNTLQQNPQALAQRVAATVNPAKYPTLYAIALNEAKNQPDIDKINESVQKWAEKVADIERALNPQERQAKIDDAVRTSQQTAQIIAPIKTGEAIATALGTERAKGGMLPAPWSTLDPQTGREGLNKSLALDEAYTKKMAAAQNTLNTITAAQKGNQRAASFITIEQLKSQLNRVTNTEIAATDTGASLIRNIQNDISRKFQGRPYAKTLEDSIALANLEKTAAENEYAGGQTALANNYKIGPLPHASLPRGVSPAPGARNAAPPVPTSIPEPYRRTAQYSASRQQWRYTTDGGKTWQTVQANK